MSSSFAQVLTATSTDTAGTSLATSSFAVSAGQTIAACLFTRTEQAEEAVFTGGGLTWNKVIESLDSGTSTAGHAQLYSAHASAAISSMAVESSFGAGLYTAMIVGVYDNGNSTTPTGNSSFVRNTGNVTNISIPASTANDSSISASFPATSVGWSSVSTPSGFTFRAEADTDGLSANRAAVSLADHVITTAANDSHNWSSDGGFHAANNCISVEINESGVAPPAATVVRHDLTLFGVGR